MLTTYLYRAENRQPSTAAKGKGLLLRIVVSRLIFFFINMRLSSAGG